jgi:hypothetical protein
MRAPGLLIVLLALGTVGGFASGIRSVARYQYYKAHGGYSQECGGGWGRGYGDNGWQQQQTPAPTPTVVEKIVEKQVAAPVITATPTNNNPTVNIYVNGQQQPAPSVVNTLPSDPQAR